MSMIGTGLAASVANAHVSSKQSAKAQKKDNTDSAQRASRMKDAFESQLKGVGEGDDDNSGDRLHLDSEMPDQGTPGYYAPEEEEEGEGEGKDVGSQMLKDLMPRHLQSPYNQAPPESKLDISG